MSTVRQQTEKLRNHLLGLKDRFEQTPPPENRRDRDFFQMVKEETDPIYDLLSEWETDASQLVKERKLKVHPHQVASTKENMELLLMHSYFIDARPKRYMELHQSVIYIFDQILHDLAEPENKQEENDT